MRRLVSSFLVRRVAAARVPTLVFTALAAAPLSADDVLREIPANAAGVIVIPRPAEAIGKLNALAHRIHPEAKPVSIDDFGALADLPKGEWDPAHSVVIVFPGPTFDRSSIIVRFTPSARGALAEKLEESDGAVIKTDDGDPGFALMRDGRASVSRRRKTLRLLRVDRRSAGLASRLDGPAKELFRECDAVACFSMPRWRQRIAPVISLTTGMMRFQFAAEQAKHEDPTVLAEGQAVVDWLCNGIGAVVDQLQTLTVGLELEGASLRLRHHHTFAPGGTIAEYLSNVQSRGTEFAQALPDRPFLLAAWSDWHVAPERSVALHFTRSLLEVEAVKAKIAPDKREELLDRLRRYGEIQRGTYFMLFSEEPGFVPLRIFGGDWVDDAEQAVEHFRVIQEVSAGVMSLSMVGVNCPSTRFEARIAGGHKCFELLLDDGKLTHTMKRDLTAMYGPDVRFQFACDGAHHFVYSIAGGDTDITELLAEKGRRSLSRSARARKALAALPADRNLTVLVDLQRLLAALPSIIEASGPSQGPRAPEPASMPSESSSLLAWSCRAGPNSLTGTLAIDVDDAARTVHSAEHLFKKLKSARPSRPPPVPTTQPQDVRPPRRDSP